MIKFLNQFTNMGKTLLFLNLISLLGALFLHRYDGLPFMALRLLGVFVSFRK